MNPLGQQIAARIRETGPITLADYMAECLLHPTLGYYTTRDPFGAKGDFTTAPEITQMFGELIGLCLAQSWLDQGAPAPFTLAELGPGRGTMMADAIRATRAVPGFHQAMRVTLLEASPNLRARQCQTIPAELTYIDHTADLPQAPLYLIANEFFDALPIRQFQRSGPGWRERLVGIQADTLTLGLSDPTPIPALSHRMTDTTDGDIVEFCPLVPAIIAPIAQRLTHHGGAALIIDYGGWNSRGDTFQAMKSSTYTDPFADPGQADLTAHVDFAAVAAASTTPHRYLTQGAFLTQLGLQSRAARLAENLTGPALQSHLVATHRLTAAAEMGTLFKVLALYPEVSPPPPGTA